MDINLSILRSIKSIKFCIEARASSKVTFQELQTLWFLEFFDAVAKTCPGDLIVVGLQKGLKEGLVSFADLSEHPAYCFVDEIFLVTEKQLGELEGIVELSLSDEGQGGYDGNPPLPERGAFDKSIKESSWIVLGLNFLEGGAARVDILSDDIGSGEVDQVPIIDVNYAVQVHLVHLFLVLCFFELMIHHNKGYEPILVYLAAQYGCYLLVGHIFVVGGYFPAFWIGQAKEHISFAVFSRPRLEKSHHLFGLHRICQLRHCCLHCLQGHLLYKFNQNHLQLIEMRTLSIFALLIVLVWSKWGPMHEITGEASKQLSDGIRAELLNNMIFFPNQTVKQSLINDLNQPDDSKRTLTSIDNVSVDAIFAIFKLKNPGCDANKDGVVSGDELKCLSKIWKNFVPNG